MSEHLQHVTLPGSTDEAVRVSRILPDIWGSARKMGAGGIVTCSYGEAMKMGGRGERNLREY